VGRFRSLETLRHSRTSHSTRLKP